jgi:hypothetical protein
VGIDGVGECEEGSEGGEGDTRIKRQELESDARIDMLVIMEKRRGRNDV